MNNSLNLINRFERLKGVFQLDYRNSFESAYFKDQALAQIAIVDCILNNQHIHRYTKYGLLSFLFTLKANDHADSAVISDYCYFILAFNDYVQLLQNEISYSMIAGVQVTFFQ